MSSIVKQTLVSVSLAVISVGGAASQALGGDRDIEFDLPPVVAAVACDSAPHDRSLVTVQLRLSSMIVSPTPPTIDQWIVRCQPRDAEIAIADYAPRTETSSDVASPIQVKRTEEKSQSLGLSLDGAYGHLAHGNMGTDHGSKNVNTVEFQRQAPVQAVTAAGTINRGRGVYFKLRWTSQQVLEGEKTFRITFAVPPTWRGSLIDVSVVAQADQKLFGGLDHEIRTIGAANFVVAAYRWGDDIAAAQATEIAEAEFLLREAARKIAASDAPKSLPSMLRRVAMKLDLEPDTPNQQSSGQQWLGRLLMGSADPHLDDQIVKLPMAVRIAALDYVDCRDQFVSLSRQPTLASRSTRVLAAKPAME